MAYSDDEAGKLNELFEALQIRFNSDVAPRLLSTLPTETLPTDPTALTGFRSRISLLIEYSVIELLAEYLCVDSDGQQRVTFNTVNQFADCFVRDGATWRLNKRIDIKTTHIASDEASARYTTPIDEIDQDRDWLLYIVWDFRECDFAGLTLRSPQILDGVFLRGITVARERDLRQRLAGGSFDDDGQPLTNNGHKDTNFGKVRRIVHNTRENAPDLNPDIAHLLRMARGLGKPTPQKPR